VNVFFIQHFLEVARKLSRFCKMARRSKVVGPRWHRKGKNLIKCLYFNACIFTNAFNRFL